MAGCSASADKMLQRTSQASSATKRSRSKGQERSTPKLAKALADYHLFHAALADLARRAGRTDVARAAYLEALACVQNPAERAYLQDRLDALPQ